MTTPDKATMAEIEALVVQYREAWRDCIEQMDSEARDRENWDGSDHNIAAFDRVMDAALARPAPPPTRETNINLVENLFLDIPILDWPCEAQFKIATRVAANVGYVLAPEPLIDRPAPAAEVTDLETIQTLLDLLNPLHGSLDKQTYDDKVRAGFDAPSDAEYAVNVTAQQERDLTQAVMILEDRKRQALAAGRGKL